MMGLILAAGAGTRMENSTTPKCLLNLGGLSIIEYQLQCFKEFGINDIVMVVGFNSDMIKERVGTNVKYVSNLNYRTTNNLYSMWEARRSINDDFICIYSDLLFHKDILKNCIDSQSNVCLMVEKKTREETMRVKIHDNQITQVNKLIPFGNADGNFIGMAKFSKDEKKFLFDEINELIQTGSQQSYYTSAIENLISKGRLINYAYTAGYPWIDIDTIDELSAAKTVFRDFISSTTF
jgi:choline kinase|tara:strand:+ start:1259 stop:1969 length:711 start_codon:yes stop_codon:yes gene_type:complete